MATSCATPSCRRDHDYTYYGYTYYDYTYYGYTYYGYTYYGYTYYGDAHPEGEPLPVVVTARGLKGVHSREHAVPQGQHLARRVGHGAETARLGDAVRGVRAGLAAARLVPQCGGERAEVVRDGLLRLGSGLGFG